MTRVVVFGGRDYKDYKFLCTVLDALHKQEHFTVLIEGEARGVDKLSRKWAEERGIPVLPFPANWRKYFKGAGAIRNKQMIKEGKPDLAIGFPGGKGTTDMTKQVIANGIRLIEVEIDG